MTAAVLQPTTTDLVDWLKLQSAPDAATTIVYGECMATALDEIESRCNLPDQSAYLQTSAITLPVVVVLNTNDNFYFGSDLYTVAPGTYTTVATLAVAVAAATKSGGAALSAVLSVEAYGTTKLQFTDVSTGTNVTQFSTGTHSLLSTLGITNHTALVNDAYPQRLRTAVLLLASRLAKRSTSPEGVAGLSDLGIVVRVLSQDPDIERLIRRFLKLDGFA